MNTYEVVDQQAGAAFQGVSELPKVATETWTRDQDDHDLWHGPHGVIVNTAALEARKVYYEIVKQEF